MNMNKTLIHKGSTKDVFEQGENLVFEFSDRYSVFDWGEMPDLIPQKGLALAKFTRKIYRELEDKGIKTHLQNLPVGDNEIAVKPFRVVRSGDSSMVQEENLFIPLEIIFRLGVAKGSSLLKRSNAYYEGQKFSGPVIEFTTKLERFDRPLSHEEAKTLAGFRESEWNDLIKKTSDIALFLQDVFLKAGIELWDGKVEFAFGKEINGQREIILVDSIGPDELRLSKDHIQLSKEIMRQYYKKTPWYQTMEDGKKEFGSEFKKFVPQPEKLAPHFLSAVSGLYTVLAEIILNDDRASLEKAKTELSSLMTFFKDFQ